MAVAAGGATLRLLRDESPYEYLDQIGDRLAAGVGQTALDAGIPHCVQHVGSMMTLFFNRVQCENWPDADRNRDHFARYFWGMIDHSVYMPCSQFEALFISREHSLEMIDPTIEAARKVYLAFRQIDWSRRGVVPVSVQYRRNRCLRTVEASLV